MPPTKKPKPTLVQVLIQRLNQNVSWVAYPAPSWFPYEILAYGWSDGIMTWKETRD